MRRIEFVFFDAGGGHRSAATALQSVIAQQGRPWDVRLFNLQEQLDRLDILRRLFGIRIQDFYNQLLKSGFTLGSAQLLRVLQLAVVVWHRATVRALADYWRASQPDMVVSFIPHFNKALCESLRRVFPERPFVTILTDLANYPPRFWMERQEQDFICGTERAVEQARELGHAANRIFRVSGMILHPRFYEGGLPDPRMERQAQGLRPELPTALVLFGGQGSRVMLEIAERLERSGLELQLILICGRNEKLAARLRGRKMRMPVLVEGFTTRIPYYMHLADFFIGKPGPGSLSEAVAMGLPVIVERNAWTLPQERYNTEWVREKDTGIVVRNFREIEGAAREMLRPETLARFRKNVAGMQNRAVFEIPAILERILERDARA
jgi:1,2-diacylglycerol 3-beta-galactosyltransferase